MGTMDDILVKYMLGEASNQEVQAIDEWVKASEENMQYFTHFKLIWQTGELLQIESKLDENKSWDEFKEMAIVKKPETVVKAINPTLRWLSIAAMLLVCFGAGALLYTVLKPSKISMVTFAATQTVRVDTLPDGSVITLNKNSAITYPDRFAGNTRQIKLNNGEAFFSIAHNKAKPFLINVNDVVIKVVGTSFNIKTTQSKTEVIVETGVVQVIRKKVVIKLKAKDKADIDNLSGNITKGFTTDQLYNYYRTKQLVADKTPLWRVIEVLNEIYGANITLNNKKLANLTLTTTLNTTSLDSNLRIIGETFRAQIIRKPGKIIIQ
jgi:transmembrane sensor